MKFKVVGWLDLIFGCAGMFLQGILLSFTYTKLLSLYSFMGGVVPLTVRLFPFLTVIGFIVSAGIAYLGSRLVFTKAGSEKTFKLGLIALVCIFFFGSLYISISMYTLISPSTATPPSSTPR